MKISSLDRRKFIRGAGVALTLPWLETFAASNSRSSSPKKRLACFYIPDGVPMPLQNDPAFQDWSWFPFSVASHTPLFVKLTDTIMPINSSLEPTPALVKITKTASQSTNSSPPKLAAKPGMTASSSAPMAAQADLVPHRRCPITNKAVPSPQRTAPSSSLINSL